MNAGSSDIPLAHWGGFVNRQQLWSSNGPNPLWFPGGWMEFCGGVLVCSAPPASIPYHPYLAYISFPQQRIPKYFFRWLSLGQVPCGIFYDAEVSLSISSGTDLGTSFSYKVTNPLDYGKLNGKRVHPQCQIPYFKSVAITTINTKIWNTENNFYSVHSMLYKCKAQHVDIE